MGASDAELSSRSSSKIPVVMADSGCWAGWRAGKESLELVPRPLLLPVYLALILSWGCEFPEWVAAALHRICDGPRAAGSCRLSVLCGTACLHLKKIMIFFRGCC